jgi:hypothetical protein
VVFIKKCSDCNKEKPLNEYYFNFIKKKNGEVKISYHPRCRACSVIRNSEYRIKNDNREKRLVTQKQYNKREETKEYQNKMRRDGYRKEYLSEYRKSNPNKIKEYNKKYSNKKHKITMKEWDACRLYFDYRCAYCGKTWEQNKKETRKDLHQEHAYDDGANDLSNCIPSCQSCNSSKRENDYIEWYSINNPLFKQERIEKIDKWLIEEYKRYIEFIQ